MVWDLPHTLMRARRPEDKVAEVCVCVCCTWMCVTVCMQLAKVYEAEMSCNQF